MTATPQPPADAAAPSAPARKPGGIVRWGVLAFLLVFALAFTFGAGGCVAKWAIQKYGSQALGTDVVVEGAGFNPLTMSLSIRGLRVREPVAREEDRASAARQDQFTAEEIAAKLDVLASLRGQVVIDRAVVAKPRGRIVRGPDGSINGTATEEPPEGTSPDDPGWRKTLEEKARRRDLVEDLKKLAEKLKERREKKEQERRAAEKRRAEQGIASREDFEGRAGWVRERRPLLVVRHLEARDVEVQVEDRAAGAPPQTVTSATLLVENWSTSPSTHDKPMEMKFEGVLAGAADSLVKLDGLLDLRAEDALSRVVVSLKNLPLEKLDAYYRDALPVAFVGASLGSLDLPLEFRGWNIDWKPEILLDRIEARARDPRGKIAGFEASRVAQELTNAGKLLLRDIRVHGPIWAPEVEGDVETVKALLLEGGKAYAVKQGQKLAAEGQKLVEKEAGKLLEKSPEAQKALEKTGADKVLKGAGGDAAKGATDALKKGLGGLFGGDAGDEKEK